MAEKENEFNPIAFYDEAHRQISRLHFIYGALCEEDPLSYRDSAEGACYVLEDVINALEGLIDTLPSRSGDKAGQAAQAI